MEGNSILALQVQIIIQDGILQVCLVAGFIILKVSNIWTKLFSDGLLY